VCVCKCMQNGQINNVPSRYNTDPISVTDRTMDRSTTTYTALCYSTTSSHEITDIRILSGMQCAEDWDGFGNGQHRHRRKSGKGGSRRPGCGLGVESTGRGVWERTRPLPQKKMFFFRLKCRALVNSERYLKKNLWDNLH